MQTNDFTAYHKRNVLLRMLGFDSYREYLDSELWKSIRRRVFNRHGRNCDLCGEPANQVHHNQYTLKNLSGKSLSCMFPICGQCHKDVEFDGKTKVPLHRAEKKFLIRLQKQDIELAKLGTGRRKKKAKAAPLILPTQPLPLDLTPATDGRIVFVTQAMIHAIKSFRGGWNSHQLRALGIGWPPKRGWRKAFDKGLTISLTNWEIAVANSERHRIV